MHHRRHVEGPCELIRGREMIRMCVRVDDVVHAHALTRGNAEIAVDLADFGIDDRGRAGLAAGDEVRLASACRDLFEYHTTPLELAEVATARRPSLSDCRRPKWLL